VNLRDLDGLKRYLSQYLQERTAKPSEPAQPNAGSGNGKRIGGQGS
jgi:hypothetical protein